MYLTNFIDTSHGGDPTKQINSSVSRPGLTEGPVLPTLIRFSLPILLANVIQLLYNTVDVMIISRFYGSVGTVGVSTGGDVITLLTSVGTALASGGQIYIAQLAGAKDTERLRKATGTLWTFMLLCALALLAICMGCARIFLGWLNTPDEAMENAYTYMMITNLGLPLIYLYNAVSGTIRSHGDSLPPLLFASLSALTNVVLDLLLVAVFALGTKGVAIATVAGQAISCIASLLYARRHQDRYHFDFSPSAWRMDRHAFSVIMSLSVPQVIQAIALHGAQIYCSARINTFGLVASATNSIGNKINRLANVIRTSLCTATSSMVGQALGARKTERVGKIVWTAVAFALGIAVVNCTLAIFFPRQIFGLFNQEEEVLALGETFMHISVFAFLMSAVMGPLNSVVVASGASGLSMIIGLLDGVVCRIGISLLLADVFQMGIVGFFWGNCLCLSVPLVISLIYYVSRKWQTRCLLAT